MEPKYYLLCPLCSYETEHITLARSYAHAKLRKKWMVCLQCRHLQEKPHKRRVFFQTLKLIWLNIKHLVQKKPKHHTSALLPKLLQEPTCTKCQSSQLLMWDGQCPKCGSSFLKKIV